MDSMPNIINEKRKYKQRIGWTDTADQMLLEMWEEKIPQLRGNRKNQHVYTEIAVELQKTGFSVSALDVKNKVNNLTSRYRKEKLLTGPSGGSPSQWPLYAQLHRLLGSFKYYDNLRDITVDSITGPSADASPAAEASPSTEAAASLTDENLFESTPIAASALSQPSPTPSTSTSIAESSAPTLPAKKAKFQQQILKQMTEANKKIDEQIIKMEEMDEKMLQLESKKTDLLDKLVTKQCEVMDGLLDYVNSKK